MVRPDLGDEEAEAAARVVRSGWVLQGPEVAGFERELAAVVGAAEAVAVSSGTTALELALRVLGVGAGDEVATVSHSFIATANAVLAVGARPVFVDVEADNLGLDPGRLTAALGPRTRAVLCVHQLGLPCDLKGVLAAARGIPVVEDAACALGTETALAGRWERIGRPHGVMACFSFHPRKVITTGDGGMITTADPALARRLRLLRQHAMAVSPEARDRDPAAPDSFLEPGYNARMTDLAAAVGRPQLRRLDAALAERRRLAAAFTAALIDHPVLEPPAPRPDARPNWQSFPAFVRAGAPLTAERSLRLLGERGIACRRGVTNAHQEPAYAGRGNWSGGPLPVSERLRETTVLLPLFHGMTAGEEALVLGALDSLRRAS
jgi:dTDP-4-amino-4,6-dideoxygalactose transaminase